MKKILAAALLVLFSNLALGQSSVITTAANQPKQPSTILGKSAIPFIGLGSCTMSAAGALSACTALPVAYANAYCYLPANAAATSIAAGWYYCTFSTTQAGTVFLNTYTSGTPTIPVSPTAVTTGSSFTGDIGEEFGPTITIPPNAMGPNGSVRMFASVRATVTANSKTLRFRFSGSGGTMLNSFIDNSALGHSATMLLANRGVTNSQISAALTHESFGPNNNDAATAVDTTSASSIVISEQRATATDNVIIETFLIELFADGS